MRLKRSRGSRKGRRFSCDHPGIFSLLSRAGKGRLPVVSSGCLLRLRKRRGLFCRASQVAVGLAIDRLRLVFGRGGPGSDDDRQERGRSRQTLSQDPACLDRPFHFVGRGLPQKAHQSLDPPQIAQGMVAQGEQFFHERPGLGPDVPGLFLQRPGQGFKERYMCRGKMARMALIL